MLKNHQELNMQVKILLFSLLWTLTFSCKSSPPPQESCDYFTMNKFNKLLVATGVPYANGRNVEVIDLDNPSKTCILSADFPYELRDAVGGFTSCGPMVCSGHYGSSYSADCYSLRSNGQFVKMSELTMDTPRSDASSIVTEDGKLMISGGWNGGRLADTEIINVLESKTEDGFELPNGISDHCSVLINTTTVMVLGGYDGLLTQKSTYFINLETLQVTDGPEMQEARRYFGCAVFEHNQHNFVIAAGGFPSTDSTEFLQLEATRLRWSRGPTLPVRMADFPLVSTSMGILAVGGWISKNGIIQLNCPEGQEVSDCHWDEFPQKLQVGRHYHVVIPLPASYEVPCNN